MALAVRVVCLWPPAAVQNIALTSNNVVVYNAAVVAIGPLRLCLSGNTAAAQAAARVAVSLPASHQSNLIRPCWRGQYLDVYLLRCCLKMLTVQDR